MEEIKDIIDKEYIKFFRLQRSIKVAKEWFYDFCNILIKQKYSIEQ